MNRQSAKVLQYLRTYKGITSLEAFQELGITRLSARIWDLRHLGYSIGKRPRKARDRDGVITTFTEYYLEDLNG